MLVATPNRILLATQFGIGQRASSTRSPFGCTVDVASHPGARDVGPAGAWANGGPAAGGDRAAEPGTLRDKLLHGRREIDAFRQTIFLFWHKIPYPDSACLWELLTATTASIRDKAGRAQVMTLKSK